MEYPCRFCFKIHCLKHRTPEDHACPTDLRKIAQAQLAESLQKVEKEKVEKI